MLARTRAAAPPVMLCLVCLVVFAVPGCDRLNPSWCEEKASCAADEVCDPTSNTCRPREAGVAPDAPGTDATPEASPDLPIEDSGPDIPVSSDLAPDLAPPDQRPPDHAPVKPDLAPTG